MNSTGKLRLATDLMSGGKGFSSVTDVKFSKGSGVLTVGIGGESRRAADEKKNSAQPRVLHFSGRGQVRESFE